MSRAWAKAPTTTHLGEGWGEPEKVSVGGSKGRCGEGVVSHRRGLLQDHRTLSYPHSLGGLCIPPKLLILARPAGLEPATSAFGGLSSAYKSTT